MPVTQPLPDGPYTVGAGTPGQDAADLVAFLTQKGSGTDAEDRARVNHTGMQATATVTGLDASLTAKLDSTLASATYAPSGRAPLLAATGYSPIGRYNPNTGVYNLTGANWRRARFALARAAAGTGLCRIGIIGTSIEAGFGTTTTSTDQWPSVLREQLGVMGYPIAGTGDVMAGPRGVFQASLIDNRWTGNWPPFNVTDDIGGFGFLSNASGQVETFTSDKAGTVAEFTYAINAGLGNMTVVVKNAAGTTLSTTSYVTAGAFAVQRVTLTGLVLDVGSTIAFTSTTTAPCAIFSAGVRKTTGVLVTNLGIGSATTATFNRFGSSAPFTAGVVAKGVLAAGVDILIVSLGINDATGSQSNATTPAQFATNLAAIIAELKPSTADAALIHPLPGGAGGVEAAVWGTPTTTGYDSSTFYKRADALGLPMLDESDRWQDYASANTAGMFADARHPTTAGARRIGLDVASFLTS